ncbi:MAG: Rpn family recombination-promoting nuclease/putative transposase [Fusobacteriaceae bacterium]
MPKKNPRIDIVFKKLFSQDENKELLISFINSIVDEKSKISDLIIKNPYIEEDFLSNNLPQIDVRGKSKINEEWYNIELQIMRHENYDKRALYHWAKIYDSQASIDLDFESLEKTISINFLNFNVVPEKNYHNVYKLINKETGKELNDQSEIHFIEFEKYDVNRNSITPLDRWTHFMRDASVMTELPGDLVSTTEIKTAFDLLDDIEMSESEKVYYDNRLKWFKNEESALRTAKKEAVFEEKRKTAIILSKMGLSLFSIAEATGLPDTEIEKLSKDNF